MENDVKEDLEQARPKLELEKQKLELEKLTQEKEQEIKKKIRKEESIFTLLLFFYSCFILF
ncbi:hypothetical protein VN0272_03660 [Helicobacter pylori]|nr:hypothetical protein VN0272_03660 [Helicobacter pylori]